MIGKRPGENMCVGLISAVRSEGSFLARRLNLRRSHPAHHVPSFIGKMDGARIIYSLSGMGKTNAAHAATVLIREYSPSLMINFGIGGAYPSSELAVGDIMVAETEIYGDEGVLDKEGFHGTDYIGIPFLNRGRKKYFNEFDLDRGLAEAATGSARDAFRGIADTPKVWSGRFVTVSTCTGTRKRAVELRKMWRAICENMEGAAIAHICELHGVPMIEIRGVSNLVGDRDTSAWDVKLASRNCCEAVMQLLKTLTDY